MSNFLNKIPVSPITSFGNPSVPNGSTFGTNFSVLQTGGYMEVYTLSGLTYTIPPTTGLIEFSGNSIPIQLTKGSGSAFSPDVLTLNSDNISSGRRKLGMLVYVYETNKIYQFRIDNYDTLWNNATGATGPGGPTVVISDFGTTVKNNSPEGQSFIDAWTASTISGVGGYNDTNASWRVLSTGGSSSGTFTGGTVTGATIFTNGLTANTFSSGTYYNLPVSGVTGGTGISASTSDGLVTIVNTAPDQVVTITGGTNIGINGAYPNFGINFTGSTGISGDFLPLSGGTVSGATIFTSGLTANTISATTYQNLPVSGVTGGTGISANTSNGFVTIVNTSPDQIVTLSGGTGISTGGTYPNFVLINTAPDRTVTITGGTNISVNGTYPNFGVSVTGITNLLNNYLPLSGGTVTGATRFTSGLTANTISATTYQNLPIDIYVSGGTIGNGPGIKDNDITLNRTSGSTVTLLKLVDIVNVTKSEIDSLIGANKIIRGKTYKISGCDTSLYYNGIGDKDVAVYTTIYLMGLENDKLTETGVGIFYTPKYEYSIFTNGQNYLAGDKVIWGGFVWTCEIEGTYNSLDIFTLESPYFVINLPFKEGVLDSDNYNIRYDDIIYDYENDKIIYRNENDTNIVQTNVENISYWINVKSLYNPIKAFQWGNVYNGSNGIGNQRIINSYNENINYKGLYQTNFYFNNLSYQTDVFVDSENSYQTNFHFENKSYQSNSNIEKASYQDSLYFTTNSYQTTVNIDNGSHQKNITLNNDSYQDSLLLNKSGSYQNNFNFNNGSYQTNITFNSNSSQLGLTFNNGSYQYNVNFYDTKGDTPKQQFFNFDNVSYQSNFDIYDIIQSYFEFDNGSYQSSISCTNNQTNFIFDDGSQYNNGNLNNTQENVTIKGFSRDVNGLTVNENGVYFIHDLPIKTTSKLIGKVNNELIEVDNLSYDGSKWVLDGTIHVNTISATTYDNLPLTSGDYLPLSGGTVTGATIFTSGLTANTISATTYQNLPVSGVTGGTGISANTTNGLVTIVNTTPDQIVTITGGTNISVNGTYPNFGINFTGSTGASGDFLSLSGGTVTGATIFTSGLTANTISATTITSPSISPYGLIVATSIGYQNIF